MLFGFGVLGVLFYLRRGDGRLPKGPASGSVVVDMDQPVVLGTESTEMATAM